MNDILLNQDDTYEVQLASIITNYDEIILFRLYQPIIGYGPVNVYLSLLHEIEGEKIVTTGVKKHNRLFETMLINNNKFIKFRRYLEAVGLLKTFVLEGESFNRYIYKLYAPLMPNKFFSHPILNNLFKRNVSVEEYERTKLYFTDKISVKSTYKDISVSVNDIFFNDLKNMKSDDYVNSSNIRDRLEGEVILNFDFEAFLIGLKDYQIPKKILTDAVLKEIASFATLYKISAIEMRSIVAQAIEFDGSEKRINLDRLQHFAKIFYDTNIKNSKPIKKVPTNNETNVNLLPGNSSIAKKVQLFNDVTPLEFLTIRNNNKPPLSCDVELVRKIQSSTGLLDPVINVILDYSLAKLNNKLIPNYVERVAASLAREGIKDAYEAMLYLNKITKKTEKKVEKPYQEQPQVTKEKDDEEIDMEYKWW